jgi:hypothetical protein
LALGGEMAATTTFGAVMSPLPQNLAEPCESLEQAVSTTARPNLAEIAAGLTLLDETILQRLG